MYRNYQQVKSNETSPLGPWRTVLAREEKATAKMQEEKSAELENSLISVGPHFFHNPFFTSSWSLLTSLSPPHHSPLTAHSTWSWPPRPPVQYIPAYPPSQSFPWPPGQSPLSLSYFDSFPSSMCYLLSTLLCVHKFHPDPHWPRLHHITQIHYTNPSESWHFSFGFYFWLFSLFCVAGKTDYWISLKTIGIGTWKQ